MVAADVALAALARASGSPSRTWPGSCCARASEMNRLWKSVQLPNLLSQAQTDVAPAPARAFLAVLHVVVDDVVEDLAGCELVRGQLLAFEQSQGLAADRGTSLSGLEEQLDFRCRRLAGRRPASLPCA